jgi:hypothetical protein
LAGFVFYLLGQRGFLQEGFWTEYGVSTQKKLPGLSLGALGIGTFIPQFTVTVPAMAVQSVDPQAVALQVLAWLPQWK